MFFVFIFVENLEKLKKNLQREEKMPKGGIKLKNMPQKGNKNEKWAFRLIFILLYIYFLAQYI